jgi:NosR/NirI family nitrous oxide reductase transcriptional regulator
VSAWMLRVRSYSLCVAVRNSVKAAVFVMLIACGSSVALAEQTSVLAEFSEAFIPPELIAGADSVGAIETTVPVMPVYKGTEKVGYAFVTSDFVNTNGISGRPIDILVAVDMLGVIRSINLLRHTEPMMLIGLPEARFIAALEKNVGLNIVDYVVSEGAEHKVDAVSGATVTVMVMDDTILNSTIMVARSQGLGGLGPQKKQQGPAYEINPTIDVTKGFQALVDEGAVRKLSLTVAAVNEAFEVDGDPLAIAKPEPGPGEDNFIELYAAVVSIPSIGRSLLGEVEYKNLMERIEPGEQAILLAGDGRYSLKGSEYERSGIFDRFQIIQNDKSFRFDGSGHKNLPKVAAAGAPDLKDVDLFRTPAELGFDPAAPWQLELLVGRPTGPTSKAFTTFDLSYSAPKAYLQIVVPTLSELLSFEDPTLWQKFWLQRTSEISILLIALVGLAGIFFFQDWLAKRPKILDGVRVGYLIFTLFGLGLYAKSQLSVVNILAAINAMTTGFDWEFFLMSPLIFILWGAVLIGLLFWGRGLFCGWLCPFGALQELMNRCAKLLKVPQLKVPWGLHERLWTLKYVIFLVLFGFSFFSLAWAARLAEIEPFKTVIILQFARDWPFVLFAAAVLLPGLFIERFYCRYLCSLGAALAIPGRLRMFDWLKRYEDCGSPCQRCSNECMVQAIDPVGRINVNECQYCLHCQAVYYNAHQCPVMIQKRLRHERRDVRSSVHTGADLGADLGVEVADLMVKKAEQAEDGLAPDKSE